MSESIQGLLKAFAKQPGCESYKGDAKQISLVCLYLFVRQLTPALPFETFLQLYSQFADADEQNLKLPETAVDVLLPRAAAKAQKQQTRQWSAKEVIGFLSLYVDMIREAEQSNTPVPMTLNQWVSNPQMQQMYIDGAFDVADEPTTTAEPISTAETPVTTQPVAEQQPDTTTPAAPPATTTTTAKSRKSRTAKSKVPSAAAGVLDATRPTTAGQRVLYKHASGQYVRGVTEKVETLPAADGPRTYVTLRDDSGQLHEGVSVLLVTIIDDPLPQSPQNVSPEAAVIREIIEIDITPKEAELYTSWMQQSVAISDYAYGVDLWEWDDIYTEDGVEYRLHIKLKNGDDVSGPYVDAYAAYAEEPEGQETIQFELVPRNFAILGVYMFVLPKGTVKVEIRRAEDVQTTVTA